MSGEYEEKIQEIEYQLETINVFTEDISKNTKYIKENINILTIIITVSVIIGMLFRK